MGDVSKPGHGNRKRPDQTQELIGAQPPPRSDRNGGIADRPPGRRVRDIAGALGRGVECLPIGFEAKGVLGGLSRAHDRISLLSPGLLLASSDQVTSWI